MWWKIYFWILLIILVLGYILIFTTKSVYGLADIRGMIESLIVTLGTYAYVYQKKFFSAKAWKIIFWVLLILWSLDLLYPLILKDLIPYSKIFLETEVIEGSLLNIVFSIIFSLPGLFAIYKLGQKK